MDQKPAEPVEIPLNAISEVALLGIIDNFILREGTDYGRTEATHETKVKQVRQQLERGEAKIAYDYATDSVGILTVKEWKARGI
jgi:uncharacterized protein YheU (UPF0270 family)